MTETAKYRLEVLPYLQGNGVDVGSGGDPVVLNCVSLDLSDEEFRKYNGDRHPGLVNFRGSALDLPFRDAVLDWVFSSHLIEDFPLTQWLSILSEWLRVLKGGGKLIIILPDKERWVAAIAAGQPPNCAHQHEGTPGELSDLADALNLQVLRDELIGDYSILFVAVKN